MKPVSFEKQARITHAAAETTSLDTLTAVNTGSSAIDNGFHHESNSWRSIGVCGSSAWRVQLQGGHVYTLVGYEVVTAPDNYFYSHAMTMYNSEPFTLTGVLVSRPVGENVTVYSDWTGSRDTGFEQLNDSSSWLGGASLTLLDSVSRMYISTAGDFGWRTDQTYSHTVVFEAVLTDNLNYVFQGEPASRGRQW